MAETRRKFDRDFKEGAVRLVRETGKADRGGGPGPGIKEGTLGNWCERRPAPPRDGNARWARMSGPSWPGCGRRTPSWRWSVMCSSARSPSGSRTRWGGSGGRPDRCPEG